MSSKVKVLSIPADKLKSMPNADMLVANHWPYCQDLPKSKGKLLVPRQIEEKVTKEQISAMTRMPDLWLPNSPEVERILHAQGLINTCIVQNGVNHKWFRPKKRGHALQIFTQLNMKKRRKGGKETVKVLDEIHAKFPSIPIWGFGQRGGKAPKYMKFFKVGPTALPKLYRACGIYFYAALLDGFANSVAEAMACGCVTVTAKNAGVPFATEDNTFLFKPGDNRGGADALFRAIALWNDSEKEAIKLYSAKAQKALKGYTWNKSVDQLEAAMKRAK